MSENRLLKFTNGEIDVDAVEEVSISKRLDETVGKFKIKPLKSRDYSLMKMNSTDKKGNTDEIILQYEVVMKCCVDPKFDSPEVLSAFNCATPYDLIDRILSLGELVNISNKILSVSGLSGNLASEIEEAKKS